MSGTRKLERFEILPRLEVVPQVMTIQTPIEEISPVMLAAARPSAAPAPPEPTSEVVAIAPPDTSPPPRSERAKNREPEVEQLRTRLARRFTTLADEVTAAFDEFRIGAGAWTCELTAPDGMSTKGGKQALQHLRLRPTRQGHVVLIGGVVNPVAKTAELRGYEHMTLLYRVRFGRALEITPGEWEQFLRKAEVVLREEEIRTARIPSPPELQMLLPPPGASTRQKLAIAVLAVSVFLAAIVLWRVLVAVQWI